MGRVGAASQGLVVHLPMLFYGTNVLWLQLALTGWIPGLDSTTPANTAVLSAWSAAAQLILGLVFLMRGGPQSLTTPRRLPVAAGVCMAAGPAALALAVAVPGVDAFAISLGGMLFGIGCIVSYVMWGVAFSALSPESILLNAALGQTAGGIVAYALSRLEPMPALVCLALLFAASGGAQLIALRPATPTEAVRNANRFSLETVRGLFDVRNAVPMVLVLASTVIVGLLSFSLTWYDGEMHLAVPLLSLVVCLAFLLAHVRGRLGLYAPFVLLPAISGFSTLADMVSLEASFSIVEVSLFVLSEIANVYGFAFLCIEEGRCSGRGSLLAVARTAMSAAMLVSYFACLSGAGGFLRSVSSIVLLASIFFVAGVAVGGRLSPEKTADSEIPNRRSLEDLAKSWGLSAREAEVCRWAAKGFPATHIARELFVSENTVRTHLKSIYRKAGVNGRDGLLTEIEASLRH